MRVMKPTKVLGPTGYRYMFNTRTVQFVLEGISGTVEADIEVSNNKRHFLKAGSVSLALSAPGYYSEGIYSDEFKGWKYIRINIKSIAGSSTLVAYIS